MSSLSFAMAMDGPDLAKTIETSIRALTSVSDQSDIVSVRSISDGNHKSHAIGLGQMNLHGVEVDVREIKGFFAAVVDVLAG